MIGGRDTESEERLSRIMKYDIKENSWRQDGDMKEKREYPGCLLSQDQTKMYIYGGKVKSLEVKDFDKNTCGIPDQVDALPSENNYDCFGYTFYPMWRHINKIPGFEKSDVLGFGGNSKSIIIARNSTTKFEILADITLQEEDTFHSEPNVQGDILILLGSAHIHIVNLKTKET